MTLEIREKFQHALSIFLVLCLLVGMLPMEIAAQDVVYPPQQLTIHIPSGANITLTSGPGGPFSLVQAAAMQWHFIVNGTGTLTLENVIVDGGGIWTLFPDSITTGPNVIFYRNEARRAVAPPEPPPANIQFTRSSIIGDYGEFIHLLNNYDINYIVHDVDPNIPIIDLVELTYDANGGTGGPHLVGYSVNAWVRADSVHIVLACLAANIIAPAGYTHIGWNTAADGSGSFYAVRVEIILDGNITLFAQWTLINNDHTVTFNLNGGVYAGDNDLLMQTVPHGQNATALTVNPSRTGFRFTGWEPVVNITNVTEDRTFTAQWTPDHDDDDDYHTVTFDLNGGAYSGNQALLAQTVPHGQNATALAASPSRPGFTFNGWSPALNLENVTEDRIFVAQWTADNNNGGNIGSPPPQSPYHMAYMIGYQGLIRPSDDITRAEVAALVVRVMGFAHVSGSNIIWSDNMNQNAWYYLYIQEASNTNYFVMKADGVHKTWTALKANREWWRLERPYATPYVFR